MAGKPSSGPMTRQEIQAKIVALAWQDASFRKKLTSDPKALFEQRLGVKLPAGLKISVHEEGDNSLHFVIPAKPKGKTAELSDRDLEKVAGGVQSFGDVDGGMTIPTVVGSPLVPPKIW